jgi:hypothetical protein
MIPANPLTHLFSSVSSALLWITAWIWPRLDRRASIQRVAAAGALACCLIGADYLDVRGSWTEQLPGDFTLFAITLSFLSGALWFVLGLGIYRLSRLASLVALGLYLMERIEIFLFRYSAQLRLATTVELVMSAIVMMLLVNAARATLANRRLRAS